MLTEQGRYKELLQIWHNTKNLEVKDDENESRRLKKAGR